MAYSEKLAGRIRKQLDGTKGIVEVKMFGGICFMMRGNMAIGVEKNNLVVRVGPQQYDKALKATHARPFDLTGRPLKGIIYVSEKGCKTAPALKKWIHAGISFAQSLPAK